MSRSVTEGQLGDCWASPDPHGPAVFARSIWRSIRKNSLCCHWTFQTEAFYIPVKNFNSVNRTKTSSQFFFEACFCFILSRPLIDEEKSSPNDQITLFMPSSTRPSIDTNISILLPQGLSIVEMVQLCFLLLPTLKKWMTSARTVKVCYLKPKFRWSCVSSVCQLDDKIDEVWHV